MRSISGLLMLALVASACTADPVAEEVVVAPPPPNEIVADLRADSNRDGEVRFDESDAQKATWDARSGAVFLANIDDDTERCKKTGEDTEIAACNDAANEVIDGADDLLDLARLKTKPWPSAPETASAVIAVAADGKEHVRLFKRIGPEDTDFEVLAEDGVLTVAELREGVELALEGKDVIRDVAAWDGMVEIQLTVSAEGKEVTDTVKLRVAPVLTYHHLLPAEEVFVSNTGTSGNRFMRTDLAAACTAASLPAPTEVDDRDPWTQDFFETAFMSMPGAGGKQHVIRVNLRSANVYEPDDPKSPLRAAGQFVFSTLRGKDSAGIQQFDLKHNPRMDSLNSFGNLETIPPYTLDGKSYPFGRLLLGRTPTFYPDKTFTKLLEGQSSLQPTVDIDTSWLYVGHVDETVSFVKASSPRGWVILANDATLAKKMLDDAVAAGHGSVPMFIGKRWYDDEGRPSAAEVTIDQVLADTDVMSASAEAAAEVQAQLAILKAETGVTEAEIIKIPFLHASLQGGSYAYTPGTVNGVYVADGHFVVPNPHGPMISGKDIFAEAIIAKLAPLGIKVHLAEDWDEYHAALGEVHCGTNARRKVPTAKWWEAGQ